MIFYFCVRIFHQLPILQVCLQKTWKLKALDNKSVPDSKYMKQAVRMIFNLGGSVLLTKLLLSPKVSIMKMKEETKKLAEKAATGEA